MAYTGCVMLAGDKLKVFYDYVSEIIGRPVYTHELPSLLNTIKEAAFPDFCMICKTESEPLEQRIRELEKRLSDVGSSPFDGGMSQKEYFHGETDCKRRGGWSWPSGHDNRYNGATCGVCNRFVKQPGTLWIYCPLCGARNGYQPVDAKRSFNPPVGGGGEDG